MRLTALLLASALLAAPLAPASAQTARSTASTSHAGDEPGKGDRTGMDRPDAAAKQAGEDKITPADIATAPIHEQLRSTHHVWTAGGRSIPYTATAGTLTIRDDEGKPIASMFYVAYVADHAKGDAHRPVTFFYNGGPGSSTLWLHMGSLGPVRIHTDSPQSTRNAPFDLEPNEYSLIDKSDLVFLDAIGTGFSRPLGETKTEAFWGVDQDLDAFTRGIARYVTANDRWNSPKFLFGESYGTTRSAGLSYMLQDHGIQLNGVTLLSSILNYGIRQPGYDESYIAYLPSFAATAWYHHRLQNRPPDLPGFLAEVRAWAQGPYAAALAKGQDLPPAERDAIARQLSAYTGLSPQFLINANLRVDLNRFRAEVLRDQGQIVGRYDSRFTGYNPDAGSESAEYDPSDTGITGAFVAAFQSYLSGQLDYHSDLTYRPTNYNRSLVWDWKHKAPGSNYPQNNPDVAVDLGAAMRENPHLKVESLNGWYDMATPFFGTEYDLKHMELPPSLQPNLRFSYYPSGHMVYLNPEALRSLKSDVARFYDDAAGG
ncbi:peptidase S10 [Caulobacter sp. S45]|uniref:S10 family peptidase n=1 Tax=Caulobacter sp. S45 TaxID=1641861 RepID=UPI001576E0AA|nr:peptidase S10 [Caulobacter sp. S45]